MLKGSEQAFGISHSNPDYVAWGFKRCRCSSLIFGDYVVREEAVDSASSEPHVHEVRRFYELLAAEPRVNSGPWAPR